MQRVDVDQGGGGEWVRLARAKVVVAVGLHLLVVGFRVSGLACKVQRDYGLGFMV